MTHRPIVVLLTLAAMLAAPASARAEDLKLVDWSSLLPGVSTGYQPSSADDCLAGRVQCVDAVIREMTRRFNALARSCDHDAVFALTYLRTTEVYREAIQDPSYFHDTAFVNHEDVVFAAAYFDAFDAWHSGFPARTPRAWAIAFEAADRRELPASGNQALGINAHVQYDLPFVLAAIGLVRPDGVSRKRDHDRVNEFLSRVNTRLRPEIARRLDPTIDDGDLPTHVDDVASFQIIPAWREMAWRNAERLVEAPNPAVRALVAADIDAYAASQAETLRSASRYPPGQTSAKRDAHCAANA